MVHMLGPGGCGGIRWGGEETQTKETPSSLCCIFYVYQPDSETYDVASVQEANETMGHVENCPWLLTGMLSPSLWSCPGTSF